MELYVLYDTFSVNFGINFKKIQIVSACDERRRGHFNPRGATILPKNIKVVHYGGTY